MKVNGNAAGHQVSDPGLIQRPKNFFVEYSGIVSNNAGGIKTPHLLCNPIFIIANKAYNTKSRCGVKENLAPARHYRGNLGNLGTHTNLVIPRPARWRIFYLTLVRNLSSRVIPATRFGIEVA